MTEIRDRLLTRLLLGVRTSPRHSAADPPTLTLVKSPRYELSVNAVVQFWRAETDDEAGGWCVVVNRPGTPLTGNPSIASFLHQRHAEHIAEIHNAWLDRKVRNQ